MEIRTSAEIRENIESFANEYLALLLKKKEIDGEIKELKDSFKEEGVEVGLVCSTINKIKADMKKSDSQKFEEDMVKEWIETNQQINDVIGMLTAK